MLETIIRTARAALVFSLALPSTSAAACTVDERIALAKAGYGKGEIETMCGQAAAQPRKTQKALDPNKALMNAPFEAANDPTLARLYGPEWKCEFLGDGVRVNTVKRTFGGFASRQFPYDAFYVPRTAYNFHADGAHGVISANISISARGAGRAGESCIAILIVRKGVRTAEFNGLVEEKRREFDAVLKALAQRGVEVMN